jgi:hypothetical protein
MKTIIAGSRTIKDFGVVCNATLKSGFEITEVVCGMAEGVDKLGRKWAIDASIPVKEFPADWAKFGRAAGLIRNVEMAHYAEALILVWNGVSRGSAHMLLTAQKLGLKIYEVKI